MVKTVKCTAAKPNVLSQETLAQSVRRLRAYPQLPLYPEDEFSSSTPLSRKEKLSYDAVTVKTGYRQGLNSPFSGSVVPAAQSDYNSPIKSDDLGSDRPRVRCFSCRSKSHTSAFVHVASLFYPE